MRESSQRRSTLRFPHEALNRRTLSVIQRHIIKRGKRSIFRRFFRPKKNEKLVATWRLELEKIRHVFDVRSFTSV